MTENPPPLRIRYRNWRGEERWRMLVPLSVRCDTTTWHGENQWLLHARDTETNLEKDFAFTGILEILI